MNVFKKLAKISKSGKLELQMSSDFNSQEVEIYVITKRSFETATEKSDFDLFLSFQQLVETEFHVHSYSDDYAEVLNVSKRKLNDIVKQFSGMSACRFVENKIVSVAKQFLLKTQQSVKQISYDLGYKDVYYFSRLFKKVAGLSPAKFRSQNSPSKD